MCRFVILLLFNKMQMSLRRFSAIPYLRDVAEMIDIIQILLILCSEVSRL